jgi:hypothetical protein
VKFKLDENLPVSSAAILASANPSSLTGARNAGATSHRIPILRTNSVVDSILSPPSRAAWDQDQVARYPCRWDRSALVPAPVRRVVAPGCLPMWRRRSRLRRRPLRSRRCAMSSGARRGLPYKVNGEKETRCGRA